VRSFARGNRIMNICLITPRMAISKEGVLVGGSAVSMVNLARGLAARGHRVHVVAGYSADDDIGAGRGALAAGVGHSALRTRATRSTPFYGVEFLALARKHLRRLRSAGFDIANTHSGFAHYGLVSRAASTELGVPAVHTLYCPIRGGRSALLFRWAARRIHAVVGISENVAASVRERGIRPRILSVIPPSVNADAFRPDRDGQAFRHSLGVAPDQPLLLFVGNLAPAKGLDVAIEALAHLVRRFPSARLIVTLEFERVGRDSVRTQIQRLVEGLGVAAHVIRLGFVKNMPEAMAAADALVIPFRNTDGPSDYPMPLLEAMSSGTPVVATRVGAIPELMQDGISGWLAPPADAEALAAGLATALERRADRGQIGAAARAAVVGRFSIPAVAEQTERLFEEVLSR
jgi:glycosyltransferase involved in cell wall biosynthesis